MSEHWKYDQKSRVHLLVQDKTKALKSAPRANVETKTKTYLEYYNTRHWVKSGCPIHLKQPT